MQVNSSLNERVIALTRGKIWKVKKEFTAQMWSKNLKKEVVFSEKDHAVETVCPVLGNWTTHLDIDGKRYTFEMRSFITSDR